MRQHLREIPLRGVSRGKREDGQAIVEFALILPFFVMLMFAAFAYGTWLEHHTRLDDIAQSGARAGSVARFNGQAPCAAALAAANTQASGFTLNPSSPSCTCAPDPACVPGDQITVTATADNPLTTIPLPLISITHQATISGSSTVVLQ